MKKIICLVLCIAMLFIFVGCGENNINSPEIELPPTEGLEYTLLYNGTYAVSKGTAGDLAKIVIPSKHEGVAVTSIAFMGFFDCPNLTKITIPNSVIVIGTDAFIHCRNLTNITIPDSVIQIGAGAFSDTAWYENQPNGLVYAGKVAYEYKGDCPEKVVIKNGTKGIATFAFRGCKGLTSIVIPDSVIEIGAGAFSDTAWYNNQPNGLVYAGKVAYKCKGTCPKNIVLENGTKSISPSAFESCKDLTSIVIPDSVISIGRTAFAQCGKLTNITIPSSVKSIDDKVFFWCGSLTSITYEGTMAEWEQLGYNTWSVNGTIHCTDGNIPYYEND